MFNLPFIAQATPAPVSGGDAFMQMMPYLGIMMAIMYFGMIRPERRKAKDRREMMENLKAGDRVMVGGGILGSVTRFGHSPHRGWGQNRRGARRDQ
jgi:preprotein translocase subunit YajC